MSTSTHIPCSMQDAQLDNWLDLVLKGEELPLREGSLSDIIMIDTLHHLKDPVRFLKEANRVLTGGGKLIAIEPYAGKLAYYFWNYVHHEPVDITSKLLDASPDSNDPAPGHKSHLPDMT